jgi:cystathionine gamma-synthase
MCHITIAGFSNTIRHDTTLRNAPRCYGKQLGADISFHSGTKYLGGHSDALIGTVTVSPITPRGQELLPLLKSVQIAGGGVASPWDSWLTLRGMRTLHVRVERQCKTALTLAEYLMEKMHQSRDDDNSDSSAWMAKVAVKAVHYPGLRSHPQHDVAIRQMVLATASGTEPNNGYGGVLSFELADDLEATAFAGALRVAQRATSLGGTETLVEHRASIEPPESVVSPPGLLRVSVGLEDVNDLIRDFDEAFAIVEEVLTEAKN